PGRERNCALCTGCGEVGRAEHRAANATVRCAPVREGRIGAQRTIARRRAVLGRARAWVRAERGPSAGSGGARCGAAAGQPSLHPGARHPGTGPEARGQSSLASGWRAMLTMAATRPPQTVRIATDIMTMAETDMVTPDGRERRRRRELWAGRERAEKTEGEERRKGTERTERSVERAVRAAPGERPGRGTLITSAP